MAYVNYGQSTIKVDVSADTIQPGEIVEVKYTFENGEGQFKAPTLSGLPLSSGPNVSSSFMIMNGKKNSSQTYTYIFRPDREGIIILPESSYVENGNVQRIEPVEIFVSSSFDKLPSSNATTTTSKITREKKKF